MLPNKKFRIITHAAIIMLLFIYCINLNSQAVVEFESISSNVIDDKKKNLIKHNVTVLVKGQLNTNIKIKVSDTKSGTKKKSSFQTKYLKREFVANNEQVQRHMIEILIDRNNKEEIKVETIVLQVEAETPFPSFGGTAVAKIGSKKFHTILVTSTSKSSYIYASIGSNFDYLNGGTQLKELYWDVSYLNSDINHSRWGLGSNIYKNRFISVDSTFINPSDFNEIEIIRSTQDSFFFNRRVSLADRATTAFDNYGFQLYGMHSPITGDSRLSGILQLEIILKNVTTNYKTQLIRTDTLKGPNSEKSKILLSNGRTRNPLVRQYFDFYIGTGLQYFHRNNNFYFNLRALLNRGWFNQLSSTRKSSSTTVLIDLAITERNTGIKLGFSYRPRSNINELWALNISKSLAIGNSSLFKKI